MMEMMDDVLGFVFSDKQFEYMLDDNFFWSQMTSKLVQTAVVGYGEGL